MKYQKIKKYKYILPEIETIQTGIKGYSAVHPFFTLDSSGLLTIFKGYMWDGVSGPTWDSKNTMLGGLGHDALYQMIRLEILPPFLKKDIDLLFKKLLLEKGMSDFRVGYYFWAVDNFGASSCIPGDVHIPEVLIA